MREIGGLELYLDDVTIGQTFASGTVTVEQDAIIAFARDFDPQPFHLSDEGARATMFRGLAASGWHTAALTMRLLVESEFRPVGGIIGAGMDEIRWPRPVRPGDVLRCTSEILETRRSAKRPDQGLVKARVTTVNAEGQVVQILIANLVVQCKPSREALASDTQPR